MTSAQIPSPGYLVLTSLTGPPTCGDVGWWAANGMIAGTEVITLNNILEPTVGRCGNEHFDVLIALANAGELTCASLEWAQAAGHVSADLAAHVYWRAPSCAALSEASGWGTPEWFVEWMAPLRRCESGNNYGIVSANGLYHGAYQFSSGTWRAYGGSGSAANASPAEQDYRAWLLYQRSGTSPWPHCRNYLARLPD